MRISLSVALALAMIFTFAACGENKNDDSITSEREPITNDSSNEQNAAAVDPTEESGQNSADENEAVEGVKIKLIFENQEIIVNMYDNPTSRAFLERLPLMLTFKDFSGFEKMSVLEEGLTTEGAPEGITPSAGYFAYYAPWKDITIFYDDWRYSPGLIQLGKIDSGIEELSEKFASMNDDFTVTIERMD